MSSKKREFSDNKTIFFFLGGGWQLINSPLLFLFTKIHPMMVTVNSGALGPGGLDSRKTKWIGILRGITGAQTTNLPLDEH